MAMDGRIAAFQRCNQRAPGVPRCETFLHSRQRLRPNRAHSFQGVLARFALAICGAFSYRLWLRSAVDIVGRTISKKLGGRLGQPIVVENKAGAGTVVGAAYVANAPADGYTLLISSGSTFT